MCSKKSIHNELILNRYHFTNNIYRTWPGYSWCNAVLQHTAACRAGEMSWHVTCSLYFLRLASDLSNPIKRILFNISIKFSPLDNKSKLVIFRDSYPALWFYCWNLCCPFNIDKTSVQNKERNAAICFGEKKNISVFAVESK